MNYLRSAELIV
jgi:hypothetical protein